MDLASLHEKHRVSQSITFDNTNQRLFVAQLQDNSDGNDLCISQLDLTGALVGWVHLPNAGHGVSIGVEPAGEDSYLWTEADSSSPAATGRGTALQRFRFVSGQKSPDAQILLPGSTDVTCATDAASQHLLVRRRVADAAEYTVHELARARQGDFGAPLYAPVRPAAPNGTFQGYAFQGPWLNLLTGSGHPDPADIDSALTSIDLRTGAVVEDHVPERSGAALPFREPEGIAIHRTGEGGLQLCFGYSSRDRVQGTLRFLNVFSKQQLVR